MTADRPSAGILLMIGFCILAPLGDSIAKLLGDTIPLGQLVLTRFAIQAAILLPVVIFTRRDLRMSRRMLGLTVVRTLLHIVGIGAMFLALRFLPLAEAVAIAFVMPFILLLLGKLALQEDVGPRRLAACTIGFAGTLLVVQPSFASVGLPALLPLVVAVVFALFMLVTRAVAKRIDPIALQATSGGMATLVLTLVVVIFSGSEVPSLTIILPTAQNGALLLVLGVLGTLAHLLMTWSLRFAPTATLAPMQYLEIPFATLIGFAIFGDFPNGLAMVGILITVSAGLFIVLREHNSKVRLSELPE